jgi:PPM family protein phosphatase
MRIAASTAESNVGRKRRHNEDSFVHAPPMFAVADGMGGAQAGEVASSLAAAALLEGDVDLSSDVEARVVELIRAANRRVHQRAIDDAAVSGMGTTMTVAVFQPAGSVVIGHVGDSRAYRLRDGELEQLTDDHSLVAELVRRGELTPEEAHVHPQRSVITRALGTESDVEVDAFTVEARAGDVFLLCSDGLTTMVDAGTVSELLQRNRFELESATHDLIRAANERGGDDNITAVVFSVGEGEPEDEPTSPTSVLPPAPDPDEEDTLHPEDGVRLPDLEEAELPRADVTMVVSAQQLEAALAAQAPEPAAGPPPLPPTPGAELPPVPTAAPPLPPGPDPGPLPPVPGAEQPPAPPTAAPPLPPVPGAEPPPDPDAGTHSAADGGEAAADDEDAVTASPLRLLIATLVIIALAALIVVLVFKELPR